MKITIDREVLMQALEVLQAPVKTVNTEAKKSKTSAALCEALAQQDSVAWEHHAKKLTQWRYCMSYNDSYFGEPAGLVKQVTGELDRLIGTSPPARKPLTVEQVEEVWMTYEKARPKNSSNHESRLQFARAIEAAHGIKETP